MERTINYQPEQEINLKKLKCQKEKNYHYLCHCSEEKVSFTSNALNQPQFKGSFAIHAKCSMDLECDLFIIIQKIGPARQVWKIKKIQIIKG